MSSSASVLLTLQGNEDVYISSDPDITFFRQMYTKHSPFGIQTLNIPTNSNKLDFGQTIRFTIPRKGDLVRKIYFRFTLPVIRDRCTDEADDTTNQTTLMWTDSVGHAIIEYAELFYGGQLVDRINSQLLEIYSDTFSDQEKQIGLKNLIGKGTYDHISSFPSRFGNNSTTPDYDRDNSFIVELPFYFSRDAVLAIPLVALDLQEVEIVLKLRTVDELIVNNHAGTSASEPIWNPTTTGPMELTKTDVLVDYVYLGKEEIEHFKTHPVEQIITQHQLSTVIAREGEVSKSIRTNFTNPVKEFFFVIQETSKTQTYKSNYYKTGNDYFNYTLDNASNCSNGLCHNITGIGLDINGVPLMDDSICDGLFLAVQQPMNYHSRVPDRLLYVYSNSLDPENSKPSGSINMSRIMHQNFHFHLNNASTGTEYPERKIYVYAISLNILRIKDGLAGVIYNAKS